MVAVTSLPTNIVVGTTGRISHTNTLHTAMNDLTNEARGAQMNLRAQTGVIGDGTADDAAAINTAATAAAALGVRLYASGTFRINSTVTFLCDVAMSQATFNYYGSGIAVQVGRTTPLFWRKDIALPSIVAAAKTVPGWSQVAGTIGVKILNAYSCRISGPLISSFETGLLVRGEGTGCVYNKISFAHLDNNKINHDISADATGWSNENHYYISRFSYNSVEGTAVSGTRDIRVLTAANLPNNNVWFGGSVETDIPEYHLECAGAENRFIQMRWENPGIGCRVYWRTGAFRNTIDRGYSAHTINETYDGSVIGQSVLTELGLRIRQSAGTAGVLQIENNSSSANSAVTIMGAGAATAGSVPATAYAAQIAATLWKLKRTTDSFDRIQIDAVNSRVYFGTGAVAPTCYFNNSGTTGIGVTGHLYPNTDNTNDAGATSLKWRYVRAGTAVQTGAFATGSRPAAATAAAGAMVFDTTLGKPIWSTGSAWVDATGATV